MKTKLVTIVVALVSTMLLPISAANAFTMSWNDEIIELRIGVAFQRTIDCAENDVTEAYFDNGVLPPGLSMSPTGVVSGTPTTAGAFTLSSFHCTYNGGYSGAIPSAQVTFNVLADQTPTPNAVLRNVGATDCRIYASYIFPEVPDDSSATFTFVNRTGSSLVIRQDMNDGAPYVADKIYQMNMPLERLNELTTSFGYVGDFDASKPFACGDELQFSVAYQYSGAPVASFDTPFVTITPTLDIDYTPMLSALNLQSTDCSFYLAYAFPETPDASSVTLSVENQTGTKLVTNDQGTGITLSSNQIYDGQTPVSLLNEVPQLPDFTGTYEEVTPFTCGDFLIFTVTYQVNNQPAFTKTVGPIQITASTDNPVQGAQPIYANQRSDQKCSVDVVYATNFLSEGTKLSIRSSQNQVNESNMVFAEGTSQSGLLTATISLNIETDNKSNMTVTQNSITNYECKGDWIVSLYDGTGELLAESLITLIENVPVCGAGFVASISNYSCDPAPIGFFTTDLSQTTATACPQGMKTLAIGSRSVNDCYKPLVQTISTLKAPKALKFGATTNLAITTNTKALAKYKVSGSCTAKVANVVTTVKGKKVTTKMLKVTASKKAGTCSVTLTSAAKDKYLAMSKPLKIKVSKTGK